MPMVRTNELRVALTVDDFEATVEFYRQVLGAELSARWEQPQGNGGVFVVPRATLEILDREMAAAVDDFEVGRRVSGEVRLALGVEDAASTLAAAEAAGAAVLGPPRTAPWGDTVARAASPDGMQLTLFSD